MRSLALSMTITWCALGKLASAQLPGIAIHPRIVVLTSRQPTGRVTIFNPKATAAEFSVALRFGTITSDSTGNARVQLADDSVATDQASAAHWVTPYPQKFTLNPGASQVVRLTASPPRTITSGEFWARLIVRSRELVPPRLPRATNDSSVHIGLSLETSTILPLFYRAGEITTGVAIDSLTATGNHDTITVRTTLRSTGSGAYLGVAQLTIADSTGTPVATLSKRVAVYHTLSPKWIVPIPLASRHQNYRLALILTTDRPDVPRGTVVRAPAVGRTIEPFTW